MELFDEEEQALPDVLNILIHVLDYGIVSDSTGRTLYYKSTITILLSHMDLRYFGEGINENGEVTDEARKLVEGELRRQFRPEFLNRLDEIVFYKPLTRNEIGKIVELMIRDLNRRLADKQLTVTLSDEAREYVVSEGYDPVYGARPLKRFLQRKIETLIARKLIASDISPRSKMEIVMQENEPCIRII